MRPSKSTKRIWRASRTVRTLNERELRYDAYRSCLRRTAKFPHPALQLVKHRDLTHRQDNERDDSTTTSASQARGQMPHLPPISAEGGGMKWPPTLQGSYRTY